MLAVENAPQPEGHQVIEQRGAMERGARLSAFVRPVGVGLFIRAPFRR